MAPAQIKPAAQVLSRAFHDDPYYTYIIPDVRRGRSFCRGFLSGSSAIGCFTGQSTPPHRARPRPYGWARMILFSIDWRDPDGPVSAPLGNETSGTNGFNSWIRRPSGCTGTSPPAALVPARARRWSRPSRPGGRRCAASTRGWSWPTGRAWPATWKRTTRRIWRSISDTDLKYAGRNDPIPRGLLYGEW